MLDFNLGFPEIATLLVIAVVLFGPDKLPEFARKAGRIIKYLRGIADDARTTLHQEIPELADVNLKELNPKNLVGTILTEPVTSSLKDAKQALVSAQRDVAELTATATAKEPAVEKTPVAKTPAETDPAANPGLVETQSQLEDPSPAVTDEKSAVFDAEAT